MILNVAAYHFFELAEPSALADWLREHCEQAGLLGTVLVAPEGLNLFLAGPEAALRGLLDQLRQWPGLQDLQCKFSHSRSQPFGRLKVRLKPEIISFRHPQATPLAAGQRAPTVDPSTLARWLAQGGRDDAGKPVVMLDTRNTQEIAYGTFTGALTLPIGKFTELPQALAPHREALRDATVVSFCTGGIRCEKAALWMQQDGMDNVLQLEGGILGYFEQVGGLGYEGGCFVFDARVALDPQLQPLVDEVREEIL
jgi:UPF0176 protein